MNNDIAIKVENLTKIYHLYDRPQDRLKEALNPFKKSYHHDFYAMSDVSFEIKKGETVGIIGKNGAGKSTLLKMITGVLTPTSGNIEINGKIASLLELGAGFNPEMTGLENIYLNGTLMGFTKEEMESKLDGILQFADINDFIDQPVKMYSSGMFARLAFAIAINVQPDILIVDEALSVGDMNFQAKCMTAMGRIQEKGTTILFVSHDINSVKSLCERGIYIKNGKMNAIGNASDIAELYIKEMREILNKEHKKPSKVLESRKVNPADVGFKRSDKFDKKVEQFRYGTGEAKVTFVELLDLNDNSLEEVEFNQAVKIRIYVESYFDNEIVVNFQILDDKKINIVAGGFKQIGEKLLKTTQGGQYIVEYTLRLPLQSSTFALQVTIGMFPDPLSMSPIIIDNVPDVCVFRVATKPNYPIWSKVDLFPKLNVTHL